MVQHFSTFFFFFNFFFCIYCSFLYDKFLEKENVCFDGLREKRHLQKEERWWNCLGLLGYYRVVQGMVMMLTTMNSKMQKDVLMKPIMSNQNGYAHRWCSIFRWFEFHWNVDRTVQTRCIADVPWYECLW